MIVMRQLATIFGLLLLQTLIGTVGIHLTAGYDWLDSLYLAVITLATVGSRDVPQPGNVVCELFIVFYIISGLGLVSFGAFQLGQQIINAQFRGLWERRRMQQTIAGLQGHYLVCGQGRMGRAICEFLTERRESFVVIDSDRSRIEQSAMPRGWLWIEGDATDDAVLRAAGIERAQALAAALPSDADNVYVVLSARLLAPTIYIVSRASDERAVVKLQRAGATRVISPIHSAGIKMARFMLSPAVEDFLELSDHHGGQLELVELAIAPSGPYVGRLLGETDLKSRQLTVVGLRRPGGTSIMSPAPQTRLEAGDSLFVFGPSQTVSQIVERAAPPG